MENVRASHCLEIQHQVTVSPALPAVIGIKKGLELQTSDLQLE
jgi:hypothetical protein